jgi:hypothetical protein
MTFHKGISWFRWSLIAMNSLSICFLLFISMKLWDLTYKPEKIYVSQDMIKSELVDSSFTVGAGNWQFSKDTKFEIVDTKYTTFENVVFIKFSDERRMEVPEPKFAQNNEEKEQKDSKVNVNGMLKLVYVNVQSKPVCTLISIVEFKAKKIES